MKKSGEEGRKGVWEEESHIDFRIHSVFFCSGIKLAEREREGGEGKKKGEATLCYYRRGRDRSPPRLCEMHIKRELFSDSPKSTSGEEEWSETGSIMHF